MKNRTVIKDRFWSRYRELVRDEMIPYQWSVLNDEADIRIEKERSDGESPSEKSHACENFRIAAGEAKGEHYGWPFQDSDVYKWLEAVSYSLNAYPDSTLKKLADDTVELIAKAQAEDGYLHTYVQIQHPELKFRRLAELHELYCAGHFFEAATAYYAVTGNQTVLNTAIKLADCLDRNFGPGKLEGTDGHEEVEIGLLKLYRCTGEKRYLNLAKYFMDVRGFCMPFFRKQLEEDPERETVWGLANGDGRYLQADMDVCGQTAARGHAVRQVYLAAAMADYAVETGDPDYWNASVRLWENVTEKQMYITGGIGATAEGESFTTDYDLPADTMYCETCASVGMVFWAKQMLRKETDSRYADIMERELYNGTISGMALDGKHFFYVNPLSVDPKRIRRDPRKTHVKTVRPSWLGCACCPPNLARLLAGLDQYIYMTKENTLLINLFIGSEGSFELKCGSIRISQETSYPQEGRVVLRAEGAAESRIAIRIPAFLDEGAFTLTKGGKQVSGKPEQGYVYLDGPFTEEEICLSFMLEPQLYMAHPYVESVSGKAALMRGPMVYCLEEADNGQHLSALSVAKNAEFHFREREWNHISTITAMGKRITPEAEAPLYSKVEKLSASEESVELTWIPYYAWANRGEGEMTVFVRLDI